jgi:hypothetical protein
VKSRNRFPTARRCRRYVRTNFSDRIMTDNFLKLYKKIIKGKKYKLIRNSLWNRRKNKLQNM